jgi:hypothetical protein
LLEGLVFAPPSFIRLGLFREGDFVVLTDLCANATPPISGTSCVALADAQQKRCVRFFMTSNTGRAVEAGQ